MVRLAHVHAVVHKPFSAYERAWGRGYMLGLSRFAINVPSFLLFPSLMFNKCRKGYSFNRVCGSLGIAQCIVLSVAIGRMH